MSRSGSGAPGRKWPRYMLRSCRRRRRLAVLTASALRGNLSAALGPDAQFAGHIAALQQQRPGRRAVTVVVHQRPLEGTHTANKSCKWVAEAIVNGPTYTATSRMAPANDIARQLVADGVPDAPMQVYTEGLKGCLVWRSFYSAAGYTFEENDRAPVKRRRPRASQDGQGVPTGPKQGVNAPAGSPVAP